MPKQRPTHNAFVLYRESRTTGIWLEIGTAYIRADAGGAHHIYLNRVPLGGFGGHLLLQPLGVSPPEPAGTEPPLPPGDTGDE